MCVWKLCQIVMLQPSLSSAISPLVFYNVTKLLWLVRSVYSN